MKSSYRLRLIGILFLFMLCCDHPTATENNQDKDIYWPDILFYVWYVPNGSWGPVCIIDSVYSGFIPGIDTTNVFRFHSSLGDYESSIADFAHGQWFGGVYIRYTQMYQEMDNVLQLPPKDQEGWILVTYYSKFSNQLCSWRFVWEIEEE